MTLAQTTPEFGERYRVERELGRGGMATVYLCTDTKFGRQVAIKLLHPELGAAVGADRFHREIQIATGLTHPNILPAFDSGQTPQGHLFYVMPFVEGESLRDRLNRERQLPVEDAVRITMQVASALQHAHSKNIVHRDIKPENILLQGQEAVVADFGIARAVTSANQAEALTQTGVSIGTPTYMSPEQAMGEKGIDGRADQYSLACVMYEMLTGQPPFVASTLQMLVMKHVGEPVPLISTVRPSVPDELEDVVLRALEKVPADRFPTVGEFGEALQGVVSTTGTWARRTATRTAQMRSTRRHPATSTEMARFGNRRAWFGAGAATAISLLALVAWNFSHDQPTARANADRVAVLYFDVNGADGRLTDLADGLTTSLIDRLSSVPALSVVSRNGVLPFRGTNAAADSVSRALGVGSLVDGFVEPARSGAEITVRLRDEEGNVVGRRTFAFDSTRGSVAVFADSLAEQVAIFLRDRMGVDARLRELQGETSSTDAWMLVQRAERRIREADSLRESGARDGALASLAAADSLLALASDEDRRWTTPVALRAQAALSGARTTGDAGATRAFIDSGLAHAERALALQPRNPDALELKGRLLYMKIDRHIVTERREMDRVLAEAEAVLNQAVAADKNQAGAWEALGALHYRKPDLLSVIRSLEKAYEADAYLRSARSILVSLFFATYNLELFPEAMQKLAEFQRRFPHDPFGIEARLFMYRAKGQPVDLDSAWAYLAEYERRTPEAQRPLRRRRGEILVAGAIARKSIDMGGDARLADSARAVLLRARTNDRSIDPRRDLAANEASVRVMLKDYDEAVSLIDQYVTVNPDHRRGFVNRTSWLWRDLEGHPGFRKLTAGL
ncbi:MAG TPA: protein kinase [Gemmatimonadaceae bacterium]|nr:protein kinase [Gemmatimonadaceae bacterium]